MEVMESLAHLMAHSPQIQQKISSRHAQTQKNTLALDALAAISSKVLEYGRAKINLEMVLTQNLSIKIFFNSTVCKERFRRSLVAQPPSSIISTHT